MKEVLQSISFTDKPFSSKLKPSILAFELNKLTVIINTRHCKQVFIEFELINQCWDVVVLDHLKKKYYDEYKVACIQVI